ncbi:Zn-ribbon domain-containing OB-fold protein [Nocardia pseudovaccinii]|uniref:Zn-ribbon domain-containing OB-fold protein n=1 Tax=Nocardia pseudovaccinii TaxID=189540 RepID=UPI003D92F134
MQCVNLHKGARRTFDVTELHGAEPEGGGPNPFPTPGAEYRHRLARGEFALPACGDCERVHYPPRVLCPYCGATALSWRQLSGLGTVYSASVLVPREGESYCVALIDLDEGPRLMSNVVGVSPSGVEIGDRVRVVIAEAGDEMVPMFRQERR